MSNTYVPYQIEYYENPNIHGAPLKATFMVMLLGTIALGVGLQTSIPFHSGQLAVSNLPCNLRIVGSTPSIILSQHWA